MGALRRFRRSPLGPLLLAGAVVAGAVMPAGASPGLAGPTSKPVLLSAQADFTAGAGARTLCVKVERTELQGTGCWNVYRLGRGGDPNFDYFVWGFQGSARGRVGARLQRLKLRMVSSEGENVR